MIAPKLVSLTSVDFIKLFAAAKEVRESTAKGEKKKVAIITRYRLTNLSFLRRRKARRK